MKNAATVPNCRLKFTTALQVFLLVALLLRNAGDDDAGDDDDDNTHGRLRFRPGVLVAVAVVVVAVVVMAKYCSGVKGNSQNNNYFGTSTGSMVLCFVRMSATFESPNTIPVQSVVQVQYSKVQYSTVSQWEEEEPQQQRPEALDF